MKKIVQTKMKCFHCLKTIGIFDFTVVDGLEPFRVIVFCSGCDPFKEFSGGASGADAVPGALGVDSIDVEFAQFLNETYGRT